MQEVNIKDYVKKMIPILAKQMNITMDSLCFCGSKEKYKDCCFQKSEDDLVFCEGSFEKVIKYRDSQGGKIEKVPLGIWGEMKEESLNRLKCLYPGCSKDTCNCHLIPENILQKTFGSFCLEFQMRDEEEYQKYEKRGKDNAMALRVFCSTHDNDLFKEIDELDIDFNNQKQLFLFALRSISFSLRKVQYLLGIDTQTWFFYPKWFLESPSNEIKKGSNHQINISPHLEEQYIRFGIINNAFDETIKAFIDKNWDFFSYFHREIEYNGSIFFAGFVNLSHDLKGTRINTSDLPINMTCNIFTKNDKLHVILSCPGKISQEAYANFFQQLQEVDEKTFISVINNILNIAGEKPLLPIDYSISNYTGKRIKKIQKYFKECMVRTSKTIFDLKNDEGIVKFIKK